jgi:hypothetical protein
MAQKMKEENKCIAISHNVLEKINKMQMMSIIKIQIYQIAL